MKRGLGVGQKPRQITDNIHGTIYLSWMESEMMSTSFFYRLHDIYQSSTVYMTFPSNRTKRYEHCLGTLELAGELFFSSVSNASTQVRSKFLACLTEEFKKIIKNRDKVSKTFYGKDGAILDIMAKYLSKDALKDLDTVKSHIGEGMQKNCIHDSALGAQMICFFDQLKTPASKTSGQDTLFFAFLYQCTLEAIRIAAMFHDVGHPPFSHILEDTLKDLYKKCSPRSGSNFVPEKAEAFVERLGPFIGTHTQPETILSVHGALNSALHEQIGLRMLQLSFESVIKSLFNDVQKGKEPLACKLTRTLYYITVVEFTFAILLEKAPVFSTLHRMLDGPIDADRLDYVVRDTTNAGTQWGQVPYKRIIHSAKLTVFGKDKLVLAFHEKVADDLDDLLVTRYKIFSRINFHHRAVKTARLMQRAVQTIAEDYLCTPMSSDEEDTLVEEPICSEIVDLWDALGDALGLSETEGQISNWNDSWLISVLHSTYIKLSDGALREKLQNDRPGRTEEDLLNLKELLEVLLLNRATYYTMLKRQRDAKRLMDGVRAMAKLTDELLNNQILHENEKLLNSSKREEQREAKDSLHRIQLLKTRTFPYGNFEELEVLLPFGYCKDVIRHTLEQGKADGRVIDYIIATNPARTSLGITKDEKDRIYLYTSISEDDPYEYDIYTTLMPLLKAQRNSCLWLHVYVKPASAVEVGKLLDDLTKQVEKEIGARVEAVFGDLLLSTKSE